MFPLPIPIGTDRRLQSFPFATVSLIVANLFVYFVLQQLPGADNFALVPARFRWWMSVTYMFTHGSFLHLAGNMLFLWVFGAHAEDALGRGRYLLVYFSAGFFAAFLHVFSAYLFYPTDLQVGLIGASGAIMGVVALFALRFHGVNVRFFFWWWWFIRIFMVRALWVGIAYVAYNLLEALIGLAVPGAGVAYWAHIGGFIVGAAWAFALHLPGEGTDEMRQGEVSRLIASGAWAAAVGVLEERLAHRPGDPDLHRQAATCYEMIRGGGPQATSHWNEYLRLMLLANRVEAAATQLRRLMSSQSQIKLEDFDPAVLLRMGTALERMGDARMAVSAWLAIPRGHHDSPEAPAAALRAAELLARAGDAHHARDLLEAISRHWPDSPEALTAAAKLSEQAE